MQQSRYSKRRGLIPWHVAVFHFLTDRAPDEIAMSTNLDDFSRRRFENPTSAHPDTPKPHQTSATPENDTAVNSGCRRVSGRVFHFERRVRTLIIGNSLQRIAA